MFTGKLVPESIREPACLLLPRLGMKSQLFYYED